MGEETEAAAEGTLTRSDLREAAYRACPSLSRAEARKIADDALDEISEALMRGERVGLRGFGNSRSGRKAKGSAAT